VSATEPKGVVVEHKALMHSTSHHGKTFGRTRTTRAFQFPSLTFDISLTEIVITLLHGGCVRVPSDAARQDNVAQAIKDLRANWALLTPSLASTITPVLVPTLKTLVLAGATGQRVWANRVLHIQCCQHGRDDARRSDECRLPLLDAMLGLRIPGILTFYCLSVLLGNFFWKDHYWPEGI
jgi:hypothetical protein